MAERVMSCRLLSRLGAGGVSAFVAVALFVLPAIAAPASAAVPEGARPGDGVVVKLRDANAASASSVASSVRGRVLGSLERGRSVVSVGRGESLDKVLGQLARDPRVEWAEPNMRYRATVQPNDPCLTSPCAGVSQWGPAKVRAPQAWDITKGSSSVRVAVIDGGVDSTHPQLVGRVDEGPDYTNAPADECDAHGTHVAGTIAAATDDGVGVAGVGWNTKVLDIRALSWDDDPQFPGCSGLLSAIAKGIDYAVANGVKVVNMSLAGLFDSRTIRESVNAATRAGVVVVAAAGNEAYAQDANGNTVPWNPVEFPAAYPDVISVAASTSSDGTAVFSNHGAWVDMAAPGYRIVSTMPGGSYGEMSGTSMATPHVAAAAALLLAGSPGIGGAEVSRRLQHWSDPYAGSTSDVRFGRLNIHAALTQVGSRPWTSGPGYWMVATDGGIFSFGSSPFYGSTGSIRLNQPIVSMTTTARRNGYWFVAADGGIFAYNMPFFGSMGGSPLPAPIVGMAATPTGFGYWLVGRDGSVYPFGDAEGYDPFVKAHGAPTAPIIGITPTLSGRGYWLVGSDGSVYPFGDAPNFGSMRGTPLNKPVVGLTSTPTGRGYWMVATDGGIFSFGDAGFYGSTGSIRLNQPIVGMKSAPRGDGYWLVASDGGIFAYNVPFFGSMGGTPLNRPVVGIA